MCTTQWSTGYFKFHFLRLTKSGTMKKAGEAERMGELKNAHKILVGKPAGYRRRGRPSRRWEDNIRLDLKRIVWENME